jgi:hypothetical protein
MFDDRWADASDEALREQFVVVQEQIAALEAYQARLVAVMVERNAHLSPEFDRGSLASWIKAHTRCSGRSAHRLVRRGRVVAALPGLGEVLAGGETTAEHLDAIAPALALLPPECVADLEDTLVDAAVKVRVKDMRDLMTHVRHRVDPDGATEAAIAAEARAGLSISPVGSDGMVAINGLLNARDGANVLAAIEPLMTPNGEDDQRTPQQRRAEALGEVCRRALLEGDLPTTGGLRPQVMVVIPLSTLTGETGAPGAHVVGHGPIDGASARAYCCDADLRRVVHDDSDGNDTTEGEWKHRLTGLLPPPLAAPSVILDLGRTRRTASTDQRVALIVRDRGCVYPGCDRDPSWCEVHHLKEWLADRGNTNLDDLALLCTEHHHELHCQHKTLRREPDGTWTLHDRDEQLLLAA